MIQSKKRSFKEYKKQTETFHATMDKTSMLAYAKYLNAPIVPGTVFYLNYNRNGNHERGNAIVKALKDKKVISSFVMRNDFSGEKHVKFIKKKSEDFFKYLATAEYIITDVTLSPYFVQKKGQCVINILDNCDTALYTAKAALSRQLLKSDVVVEATPEKGKEKVQEFVGNTWSFSGEYMSDEQVIQMIREGKKVERKPLEKKTVAIAATFDLAEIWVPRLFHVIKQYDLEKEHVILIVDNTNIEELSGYLRNIPDEVTIVTRQGWFLAEEKLQDLYAYIKTDLMVLKDVNEIYSYIKKDVYRTEFNTIAGNAKIDEFVFLGDSMTQRRYWYMMGGAVEAAKKVIGFDNSTDEEFLVQDNELRSAYESNMKKVYEMFDEVLFWGEEQKKEYLEKVEDLKAETRTVIIDEYLDYQLRMLEFNLLGKRAIAYNIFNHDKMMDIMKLPKSGYDVIVVENDDECTLEYAAKIEQIIKENADKEYFLIDLNDISKSVYTAIVDANSNISMYRGAVYLKAAMKNADKVIVGEANKRLRKILADSKVDMI
jgi:hypothetical protein